MFETALAATPGDLKFVVHAGHDADWKLVDEIFDQAADFDSWDPKTCPKLKQLKLCDAILTAHLIAAQVDTASNMLTVRLALRLIRVATAEELWGGVVEGVYSDPGPDNEKIDPNWRKALESCASNAVAKLPASLDGYGLLLLPIEGRYGKSLEQVFLNALTAAGRQEKIRVYDLPNGSASDRMLARFLRERAGSGIAVGASVLKRVETLANGMGIKDGKLALMTGRVSVTDGGGLDSNGLPAKVLVGDGQQGGITTFVIGTRIEITADFKFRDVNDNFRLIGSIGATGVYGEPKPKTKTQETSLFEMLLGYGVLAVVGIGGVCILVLLAIAYKVFKMITRAR